MRTPLEQPEFIGLAHVVPNATNGRLVNKASLAEQAYDAIKSMIMHLELRPGEPITEAMLSELLDISKSPIRTALQNLHHDGLVTTTPYKETIVTEINLEHVQGIYEARALIEPHVLRAVTPNLTKTDYEALDLLLARSRLALSQQDFTTFFDINSEFHGYFINHHGNQLFRSTIHTINTHMQRLRMVSSIITNNPTKQMDEHQQILNQVKSVSPEAAGDAMRDHIMGYYEELIEELQSPGFSWSIRPASSR